VTEVSFARRITDLATEHPDRVAVTCGGEEITWHALESAANRLARDLEGRGVGLGDMVTVALPNSVGWYVAVAAAWKLGAVPQPVSARLPERELAAIVELADARVVLGVDPASFPGRQCLPVGYRPPPTLDAGPLPDRVSPAWKAPTSGGSTGRPKLIVSGDPAVLDPEGDPPFPYVAHGQRHVMPGPLYHNAPFIISLVSLLWDGHVVVLPRFDAEATLAAIDRHRAHTVYLVPTMMRRIWRLPQEVRERYDLSSLQVLWHIAEPCPPWLKEAWIGWVGPEKVIEIYGGTEGQAATIITGTEWLQHRGSVGRPFIGEIMIGDSDGNPLPPGEQGEVWMRWTRDAPPYTYRGASARRIQGGWESLGDVGYVDADGYLYLRDRVQDMILVGGSNVYPAEVEAAIQEHPAVRSCAVIGLPDEDTGNRVHAIVQAAPEQLTEADLLAFLGERLVRYKLPRSVEIVDVDLRDDAGKVRRGALRAERLPAQSPAR
jgi:bile acid-coenzyme A ligase